jgi:hypothetical protein
MSGPRQAGVAWPSSHEFVEAMQNPRLAFRSPELQRSQPALDRFGIPLVASGNFAYAFKLREGAGQRAVAIRCFRGLIADRDKRYELIDQHLRNHREAALASFVFDAQGVLVRGQRFPIVVMEWIEGPTLDLYLQQALHSKATLESLADQWLRTVRGLRQAQLAHGDLQHGNIIVQDGRFRLIDLDAMYVPAMHGWSSNELGHLHFQHPRRDLHCFDAGIDRFSALVIYLSIIALAQAPELWQRYHDENLIFTRQDYADPAASPLFAEVRRLGAVHRQLCEALEQALRGRPADTPDLLELVSQKSSLPAWMTQAADLKIEVKTREAPAGSVPAGGSVVAAPASRPAAAASPWPSSHPAGQPAAPSSPQPAAPPWVARFLAYRPPAVFSWSEVHAEALANAVAYLLTATALLLPGLMTLGAVFHLRRLGDSAVSSGHPLLWFFLAIATLCLVGGYGAAIVAEFQRVRRLSLAYYSAAPPPQAPPATPGWFGRKAPTHRLQRLIGDKGSRVYHHPSCNDLQLLVPNQRVVFVSLAVAQARGYTPCPSCCP